MKILVTGAAGFTGNHTAIELKKLSHKVLYDRDQNGNTGDNKKLRSLGWTPMTELKYEIKKFYNKVSP